MSMQTTKDTSLSDNVTSQRDCTFAVEENRAHHWRQSGLLLTLVSAFLVGCAQPKAIVDRDRSTASWVKDARDTKMGELLGESIEDDSKPTNVTVGQKYSGTDAGALFPEWLKRKLAAAPKKCTPSPRLEPDAIPLEDAFALVLCDSGVKVYFRPDTPTTQRPGVDGTKGSGSPDGTRGSSEQIKVVMERRENGRSEKTEVASERVRATQPSSSPPNTQSDVLPDRGNDAKDTSRQIQFPNAKSKERQTSVRQEAKVSDESKDVAAQRTRGSRTSPGGRTATESGRGTSNTSPQNPGNTSATTPSVDGMDAVRKQLVRRDMLDTDRVEALDLLRAIGDLEYEFIGNTLIVSKAQLLTRTFKIDYPVFTRKGSSDSRSSRVSHDRGNYVDGGNSIVTDQENNFWMEVEKAVAVLVGAKAGEDDSNGERPYVKGSPLTSSLVVRAHPAKLRAVDNFLEATRLDLTRRVMLEVKIISVTLNNSVEQSINWGLFKSGSNTNISAGVTNFNTLGRNGSTDVTPRGPGIDLKTDRAFGLALQVRDFASVFKFLDTQGNSRLLQSPRIMAIHNQRSLLKFGGESFFVTKVGFNNVVPVSGALTTVPGSIEVAPFFSGVTLDITPSVAKDGYVTLHIHPTITNVFDNPKTVRFGNFGDITLPLASSEVNETDAVVRASSGQIVAIGGLMSRKQRAIESGLPGLQDGLIRRVFGGQSTNEFETQEMVVLIRATILDE